MTSAEQQSLQGAEHDLRIDYIEIPATRFEETKQFYTDAFGWTFTDYGPDYTSFQDGRLTGGLWRADTLEAGGILVVLFAVDLAAAEARVHRAGGEITRPTFDFPGGRRFHFADPSGNILAVWSDR